MTLRMRLRTLLAEPIVTASVQPPAPVAAPPPRSAEALYCEVARARLQDQLAVVSSADTKATTMLTIASTILPITASLLISGQGRVEGPGILAEHPYSQLALTIAIASYVLLVLAFLRVLNLSGWDTRPDLAQWRDITAGELEENMFRWLGDACVAAYKRNRPKADAKAQALAGIAIMLVLEALSLTIAVLIPIVF